MTRADQAADDYFIRAVWLPLVARVEAWRRKRRDPKCPTCRARIREAQRITYPPEAQRAWARPLRSLADRRAVGRGARPLQPQPPKEPQIIAVDSTGQATIEDRQLVHVGPLPALTLADRCDAHNVAFGLVSVCLRKSGRRLVFCGHHFDRHAEALAPLSDAVRDERVERLGDAS